jgi:Flp pilus assembly protein TadB
MSEQPKSKVLILIIGILLLANIVMLAFFLWNTNSEKKEMAREKEKNSRSKYVSDYLEKEVGFSAAQLARYDSLSKKRREQLKTTFGELSEERKTTFKTLAEASFTDSAIKDAANEIHERQKILELNMLIHLRDIRNICTEAQLPRFDTGFYKIFGRRGETHK